MIYYKTSQPVPGKGDAWMYYECNDDEAIRRYLTYIPVTGEVDRVPKPFIKKLQRPEMLMPASQEEFFEHWGEDDDGFQPEPEERPQKNAAPSQAAKGVHFDPAMTVLEAMAVHPQVGEVFAAFHLGGCAGCGVGQFETVTEVCMAYGVDLDLLLEILEGLMEEEEAPEAGESAAAVE